MADTFESQLAAASARIAELEAKYEPPKAPVASVSVDADKLGRTRFAFMVPPGRSPIELFCGLKEPVTATADLDGRAVVTFARKLDEKEIAELTGLLCR